MLVLTRRPSESIYIGNDKEIKITVISIKGRQIQLGIQAPKNIPIHREEVFDRIAQASQQEE